MGIHGARALATTAFAAVLSTASACSLVLDFSDEVAPIDGGPSDASTSRDAGLDASALCAVQEPNNALESPGTLTNGASIAASICPSGDRDFYQFELAANDSVTLVLTFINPNNESDLDLTVWDVASGTRAATSWGEEEQERIEQSPALGNALAAGIYAAEVFGFSPSVTNDYDLLLTIEADTTPDGGMP